MSVNDRVCFNNDFGTIRFNGTIAGKKGEWYGIEWDDPSRGKNDGSIDGVRYFTTKAPTGASFVKTTSPALQLGRTFLEALKDKYIEASRDEGMESIILGSSEGAIEVEAVNMNKVRSKFAKLETLKEVGLENYMIKSAGQPGQIAAVCPNIRRLDLSRNLIASWKDVVAIAEQLVHLESLTLHENIFQPLSKPLNGNCKSVTELRLNHTGVDWHQSLLIASAFPSLEKLEIGYNDLSILQSQLSSSPSRLLPHLVSLNLDSNAFADWSHVMHTILSLPNLRALYLSENQLSRIERPSPEDQPLKTINTLVMDGNPLGEWNSVDALALWLPNLRNLRVIDTPLTTDPDISRYSRQILIGRLATIQRLNSSEVSEQERKDAEIFYLNWVAKHCQLEERPKVHPRWPNLVELYGLPEEEKPTGDLTRLQNRLMNVDVYQLSNDPSPRSASTPQVTFKEKLQILPSMPLKALRLKLLKLFKIKPTSQIRVFARLRNDDAPGAWGEIDLTSSRQSDLLWWGVGDGGQIGVLLE